MEPARVPLWCDGLWAALQILDASWEITRWNLREGVPDRTLLSTIDGILGWGAFRSPVDQYMHIAHYLQPKLPIGLCIGGTAMPIQHADDYSVLFFETFWHKQQLPGDLNLKHAFGVHRKVYQKPNKADFEVLQRLAIWDYLSVGSFSRWKRHEKLLSMRGTKLAIGEIQHGNLQESIDIIGDLLLGGVAVSDMVPAEKLATLYATVGAVYIPAELHGGGERAVLEARSCGAKVIVEEDNPKLKELVTSPIYDEQYYADRLKEGMEACL